jgi:hypothetical protein
VGSNRIYILLPNRQTTMKAVLFYTTAIMIAFTLCTTSLQSLAVLSIIDAALIVACRKYLTLRDVVRYSGYDIFYKMLK